MTATRPLVPGPNPIVPLVAALTITTAGVLPGFLGGALAVQIQRDLQFDNTMLGLALAAFFGAGGLLAIPGGHLADRLGWRRSLQAAAIANIGSLFLVAWGSQGPTSFVIAMALTGSTLGLTGPTGNLVLAREMPAGRMGLVFGVKQTAIPLGTTVAGLAVPAIALTIGWRWAFVGAAIFPLIALAAGRTPTTSTSGPAASRPTERWRTTRGLVLFAMASGMATTGTGALAGFLVVSSVQLGIAEGTAGLIYAASSSTGLVTRVVVGWMADRRRARGFVAVSVMMLIGATGFLLLSARAPGLVLPGALLAFAFGWSWAGLLLYGVVRSHPQHPAAATGTVQVGSTAGVAVGPLLFGFVADRADHGTAWLVAGSLLLVSALLVRLGDRALTRGHLTRDQ